MDILPLMTILQPRKYVQSKILLKMLITHMKDALSDDDEDEEESAPMSIAQALSVVNQ